MGQRGYLAGLLLAIGMTVIGIACSREPPTVLDVPDGPQLPRTIRLLDIASPDNVVVSPLLDGRALTPDGATPIHATLSRFVPLTEPGVGQDPLGMKRRLSTEEASYAVLLAPAHTELRYEIELPAGARLHLGLGVLAQGQADGPAGTVFEVWLGDGETGSRIYQHVVDRLFAGQPPLETTISLAGTAGDTVSLRLVTRHQGEGEPDPATLSYWANPIVYSALPPDESSAGPANVVLLSVDTLSARHLGSYGYLRHTDPQLTALAADATTYLSARSQYPTTAISHMSMFTSRAPHHSRRALALEFGVQQAHDVGQPATEETLAAILRQAGWSTGAITGGGVLHHTTGFDRGFDVYLDRDDDDRPESLHRAATDWLQDHADRPFFLFLHTYQVHGPYAPPQPYSESFAVGDDPRTGMDPMDHLRPDESCAYLEPAIGAAMAGLYDGEIAYTDDRLVGPLVRTLQELGLYEDTLLIVTSDHGEEFGEHGCWTHGANLFDSTMHVPLVIRYPRGQHRGLALREPVGLLDIAPTVLAVTGVTAEAWEIEGRDLSRLHEPRPAHDPISPVNEVAGLRLTTVQTDEGVHEVMVQQYFLIEDDHKLIVTETLDAASDHVAGSARSHALYDLASDPHETLDVCARRQQLCDAMLVRALARYEPGVSLGTADRSSVGIGGEAWKRHMQDLGYIEPADRR